MVKLIIGDLQGDKELLACLDEAYKDCKAIEVAGHVCKLSDKKAVFNHSTPEASSVQFHLNTVGEIVSKLDPNAFINQELEELRKRVDDISERYVKSEDLIYLKRCIANENEALIGKPSILSRLDFIEKTISEQPTDVETALDLRDSLLRLQQEKEACYSGLSISFYDKNVLMFVGMLLGNLNEDVWSCKLDYGGSERSDACGNFLMKLTRFSPNEAEHHLKEVYINLIHDGDMKKLWLDNLNSRNFHAITCDQYNRIVKELYGYFDIAARAMSMPSSWIEYKECS
jgi:hypothetical protein